MMMRKLKSVPFSQTGAMLVGGVECGSCYAGATIMNWVKGAILSQHVGVVRAGVRIKVGARTDLRVRWVKHEERCFILGQSVIATIPADAVRLESGMFRRSRQRWNRWSGRIVLIQQVEAGTLYTVKVHGEEWTLRSLGPVLGAQQAIRPWDVVNVVVDPQVVDLSIAAPCVIVTCT